MKVTGGRSRGKVLISLKGMDIRPTSSKVREAIFNILGQDMTGIRVLDLFAGTGILGIEALSRGADGAILIDKSGQSVNIINKNLALCGYQALCRVFKMDLIKGSFFDLLSLKEKFDLVFVDPPYRKGIIPPVLTTLSSCGLLSGQALVVTESSKNDSLPERVGTLLLSDTRIYGKTKIDIYNREH